MSGSRLGTFFAGLLGGLVVLMAGAILIATDVIETGGGETSDVIRQEPIAQPATDGARRDSGRTVGEIYDRAGPGVVYVLARGTRGREESPFGFPREPEGAATGSGFVLDREGYILTNAHVVDEAERVDVRFGQGDVAEAKIVGTDLSTDIAVLKVDPDEAKLHPIPLGNSSRVRVGDPAIAIGNPFGFDRTVTTGIVSALQRQIQAPNGFSISNVIQTDASVNPGNSGGPLLDAVGRVIGINSQIATGGSSGSVGIGFAVPIDTARKVIPQLKRDGEVKRAYLGVTTVAVTSRLAEDLNLPAEHGALIQDVVDGGPADEAGLRAGRTQTGEGLTAGGDLIVKVDGREIRAPQDIATAIDDNEPGDEIEVEYYRGDDRRTVTVELGERPDSFESGPSVEPEPDAPGVPEPLP